MKADGTVSKIIVLINSANTLQLDFLKDNIYNVDACLWIGDVGITGINAVADILAGNVNPSGSLVDTYCYDNYSSPAMANFTPMIYEGYTEELIPEKAKATWYIRKVSTLDTNIMRHVMKTRLWEPEMQEAMYTVMMWHSHSVMD